MENLKYPDTTTGFGRMIIRIPLELDHWDFF